MSSFRPEQLQTMRGGAVHPTYDGVLHLAHEKGLRAVTIKVLQIAGPENGNRDIVQARVEFEDGRVFEDVGDCSPASCGPQLAPHSLRLASTRAKGRALRDGVDVGEAIAEEMDETGHLLGPPPATTGHTSSSTRPNGASNTIPPSTPSLTCGTCNKPLDQGEANISRAKIKANLIDRPYCRTHLPKPAAPALIS